MSESSHSAPASAALYVISAPSGAGKTSLVRAVLAARDDVCMSTSYTTRPMRPAEAHGRDYFFVDEPEFLRMVGADDFLEHANVFGNRYGTSRSQVGELLAGGRNVILEIDWQGAAQVRRAMPECQSVFVLPPSVPELERRLRGRQTDTDEVIARRLRDARSDMSHWDEFDYVIVNEDFDRAVAELSAIIDGAGEALHAARPALGPLIGALLDDAGSCSQTGG